MTLSTKKTIFGRRGRRSQVVLCMSLLLLLEGCAVGPRYVKPVAQAPPAFKEVIPVQASDGTTWMPATPQDATLRGKWWEIYQEPELNSLEEKLNISNQNVAQYFQNFMAARAQIKQARAAYYPTISVGPSYTRSRSSSNLAGHSAGTSTTSSSGGTSVTNSTATGTTNDFSLPFDVSWEPDVWGRVRNTVRGYANAAQVSAADLANERLTEQSNLAEYYFELRGQDSLIELYDQTIMAYRKNLELTRVRQRLGLDTGQDVAQADLNLKAAVASATNLRIARAQYEHAIAMLTGQAASSFSLPVRKLTTGVPTIPVGVSFLNCSSADLISLRRNGPWQRRTR